MQSFAEFMEQAQPWHAHKKEILELWRDLKPTPIMMRAVPTGHRGTRLRMDGIRLTGSPTFINSVLARLKELVRYETSPGTTLDLEYRLVDTKGIPDPNPDYICYVHVKQDMKKVRPLKLGQPLPSPKATHISHPPGTI